MSLKLEERTCVCRAASWKPLMIIDSLGSWVCSLTGVCYETTRVATNGYFNNRLICPSFLD